MSETRIPRSFGGRGRPARERGQSLVEFALVLPILLVLFLGIMEFGGAWRTYQVVTNVSREGARRAVIRTATEADVRDEITRILTSAGLDPSLADVLIDDGAGFGSEASVRIEYPYSITLVGPILNLLCEGGCGVSFGTITLSSESVMRNE